MSIELDYNVVLNVLATIIFSALYYLHRAEPAMEEHGGGAELAD